MSLDIRRSVDYLATIADVDTSRIAYFGLSWGGALGGIIPAVEPRVRAFILYVAGLGEQRALPEVETLQRLEPPPGRGRATRSLWTGRARRSPEARERPQIPMRADRHAARAASAFHLPPRLRFPSCPRYSIRSRTRASRSS